MPPTPESSRVTIDTANGKKQKKLQRSKIQQGEKGNSEKGRSEEQKGISKRVYEGRHGKGIEK